jgi:hypothetical protein
MHRYDDETRHFRYMPVAAYTTEREFNKRWDLEHELLEARRARGEAHRKENLVGKWDGKYPPRIARWKRIARYLAEKSRGKQFIHLYESGYAEYEEWLEEESSRKDSEKN